MLKDSRRAGLEAICHKAIDEGLTRQAAALVARDGEVWEGHFGESTPETVYDLASLTKILCTTYLCARALAENKLELEEQPWSNWPGVSVKHVLLHNSGLPAWREISSVQDALDVKPELKPGEKTVYSDIGFIALGDLIEKRLGRKLDELFKYKNLYFDRTRKVNDENCQRLGGVAGHAGLFGTLGGVYKFSEKLLDSLSKFAIYPGERALGFDKATKGGSTGDALSKSAIGHLGYTGTSLWLDPETDSIYILLMSRLDKDDSKSAEIMAVRQAFHKQAANLFSA